MRNQQQYGGVAHNRGYVSYMRIILLLCTAHEVLGADRQMGCHKYYMIKTSHFFFFQMGFLSVFQQTREFFFFTTSKQKKVDHGPPNRTAPAAAAVRCAIRIKTGLLPTHLSPTHIVNFPIVYHRFPPRDVVLQHP